MKNEHWELYVFIILLVWGLHFSHPHCQELAHMLLNSGETQQVKLKADQGSFVFWQPMSSLLCFPAFPLRCSRHYTGVIAMVLSDTRTTLGLVIQIISREDSDTARTFSSLGTCKLDLYWQQKCVTGRSDHILFNKYLRYLIALYLLKIFNRIFKVEKDLENSLWLIECKYYTQIYSIWNYICFELACLQPILSCHKSWYES